VFELPLLLALASALSWGAGDFYGGLATRDAKAIGTTFVSQGVGLVGLVVVSLLGAGGSFVGTDLAWGTAAGLCAMTGLGLFYEAMGRGAFGPVASITSVVSGAIPIVVGLALGERPSKFVLGGVCVAVFAIWLIAGEKRTAEESSSRIATMMACGAGVFFGGYFVLLSRAGGESGLWPLVAGRTAATAALGLTILILGYGNADAAWVPPRRSLQLAMVAGLLDATANALYFYASRNGLLSVVAVVASMYPASTILLARITIRERVNHRRLVGMLVGLAAVSMIAKGGAGELPAPLDPVEIPSELVFLDPDEVFEQQTLPQPETVPEQLDFTDPVSLDQTPPAELPEDLFTDLEPAPEELGFE
jgi:drug/metabolite transporter (DMT)-like permease